MDPISPDLSDSDLVPVQMMIRPPDDWLTEGVAVAADGNTQMLAALKLKKKQPAGAGARVITALAELYRNLGRTVLLFESSQAAQRVTRRLMGKPNPDDVFTVDYCTGHRLVRSDHLLSLPGDLRRYEAGNYVNLVNRTSVPTRWLEPFVMQIICGRLGVKNVLTQPPDTRLEGGDLAFLPTGEEPKSILLTGDGPHSRSNTRGRNWLYDLLQPTHRLDIISTEFHRDLVSVLVQDRRGRLAQALLALGCIVNAEEVQQRLASLGVEVVDVPADAVRRCAVNLSVSPGLVVGMQSHAELSRILKRGLPPGVVYHALPPDLQKWTAGFIDMQGGANCVSGNVIVNPREVDLSDAHVQEISRHLHSREVEDYLQAVAESLQMAEAIAESRARQES